MNARLFFSSLLVLLLSLSLGAVTVRTYDHPTYTRVVVDSNNPMEYTLEKSQGYLLLKLKGKAIQWDGEKRLPSQRVSLERVQRGKGGVVLRLKPTTPMKTKSFILKNPFRVVLDLYDPEVKAASEVNPPLVAPPMEEKALPPSIPASTPPSGVSSRQDSPLPSGKPLERIVLDPGHGGSETGAIAPGGTNEKDVTLAIAKILKRFIEDQLGIRVFLTRDGDSMVSLEERAALANNRKADLFVSLHCNASWSKEAHGSETFILSLKSTDTEARKLAFFENTFEEEDERKQAPAVENDDLKMILWDMAQVEYLKESASLAELVQKELNILLGTKDRGIKQAPFRVLMNVAMPAVLVETAFLSNGQESQMLKNDEFQRKIAYAIFLGIKRYGELRANGR